MEHLLKAEEVSEQWKVKTPRVWELTRRGELPFILVGRRQYRYRQVDVDAYIMGRRTVNNPDSIGEGYATQS